jgi:hypothetical protein
MELLTVGPGVGFTPSVNGALLGSPTVGNRVADTEQAARVWAASALEARRVILTSEGRCARDVPRDDVDCGLSGALRRTHPPTGCCNRTKWIKRTKATSPSPRTWKIRSTTGRSSGNWRRDFWQVGLGRFAESVRRQTRDIRPCVEGEISAPTRTWTSLVQKAGLPPQPLGEPRVGGMQWLALAPNPS